MSEHPPDESVPDDAPRDRSGSAAARGAWMASGITFFAVGVVFTLTMPDNIALGITFLSLGVVFFSLAGSQRAPGDGPGVAEDAGETPAGPSSPEAPPAGPVSPEAPPASEPPRD